MQGSYELRLRRSNELVLKKTKKKTKEKKKREGKSREIEKIAKSEHQYYAKGKNRVPQLRIECEGRNESEQRRKENKTVSKNHGNNYPHKELTIIGSREKKRSKKMGAEEKE